MNDNISQKRGGKAVTGVTVPVENSLGKFYEPRTRNVKIWSTEEKKKTSPSARRNFLPYERHS